MMFVQQPPNNELASYVSPGYYTHDAPLGPGGLEWKVVKTGSELSWRLVLVNAAEKIAYEGGFGNIRACTALPEDGGCPILIMSVRKSLTPKIGFQVDYSKFAAAPRLGSRGNWIKIDCEANDYQYSIFCENTPFESVSAFIDRNDDSNCIRFRDPIGKITAIRLVKGLHDHWTGRLSSTTLTGEVRGAFRMPQCFDKNNKEFYILEEDSTKVALKIYGHGYNISKDVVRGDCPKMTSDIRNSKIWKEDPVQETEILSLVKSHGGHEHIINMQTCLADTSNVYLVLDYINRGELFNVLFTRNSERNLTSEYFKGHLSPARKELMRQIVSGVRFLNEKGISHGDLSFENILIHFEDNKYRAIICDFGQGRVQSISAMGLGLLAPYPFDRAPGKVPYFAPEMLGASVGDRKPYDGSKLDLWALGIMHLVLFCDSRAILNFKIHEDVKNFHEKGLNNCLKVVKDRSTELKIPEVYVIISSLLHSLPIKRGIFSADLKTITRYSYEDEPFYHTTC